MKKKIGKILFGIIFVIVLFLLGKALYEVGVTFLSGEEIFVTEGDIISKSKAPVNTEEVVSYFNKLSDKLKDDKPSLEIEHEYKVSSSSIKAENETLEKVGPIFKDIIIEKQGEKIKENATFPNTTNPYPLHIDVDDVRFAVSNQDKHTYTLTIFFDDEKDDTVMKYFPLVNDEFINDGINTAKPYLVIDSYELDYTNSRIICVVDRETDEVQEITYIRNITSDVNATGAGLLEEQGSLDFSFVLEHITEHKLGWPEKETTTEE